MSRTARYKFEGFKVGDTIKAYDFKPGSDRTDRYVIGVIEEVDAMLQGAICYKIRVTEDTGGGDFREIVFVPYEVFLLEYNERVSLVEEGK